MHPFPLCQCLVAVHNTCQCTLCSSHTGPGRQIHIRPGVHLSFVVVCRVGWPWLFWFSLKYSVVLCMCDFFLVVLTVGRQLSFDIQELLRGTGKEKQGGVVAGGKKYSNGITLPCSQQGNFISGSTALYWLQVLSEACCHKESSFCGSGCLNIQPILFPKMPIFSLACTTASCDRTGSLQEHLQP